MNAARKPPAMMKLISYLEVLQKIVVIVGLPVASFFGIKVLGNENRITQVETRQDEGEKSRNQQFVDLKESIGNRFDSVEDWLKRIEANQKK